MIHLDNESQIFSQSFISWRKSHFKHSTVIKYTSMTSLQNYKSCEWYFMYSLGKSGSLEPLGFMFSKRTSHQICCFNVSWWNMASWVWCNKVYSYVFQFIFMLQSEETLLHVGLTVHRLSDSSLKGCFMREHNKAFCFETFWANYYFKRYQLLSYFITLC